MSAPLAQPAPLAALIAGLLILAASGAAAQTVPVATPPADIQPQPPVVVTLPPLPTPLPRETAGARPTPATPPPQPTAAVPALTPPPAVPTTGGIPTPPEIPDLAPFPSATPAPSTARREEGLPEAVLGAVVLVVALSVLGGTLWLLRARRTG